MPFCTLYLHSGDCLLYRRFLNFICQFLGLFLVSLCIFSENLHLYLFHKVYFPMFFSRNFKVSGLTLIRCLIHFRCVFGKIERYRLSFILMWKFHFPSTVCYKDYLHRVLVNFLSTWDKLKFFQKRNSQPRKWFHHICLELLLCGIFWLDNWCWRVQITVGVAPR